MGVRLPHAWQWFGDRVDNEMERRVPLHWVARIVLALAIFVGGAGLLVLGLWVIVGPTAARPPVPHPVAAFLVALLLMAMGYAFCHVAWRLAKLRTTTDKLLGRRGLLVCAALAALAAVGMARDALLSASLAMACNAVFAGLWSWGMFYSVLSRRQAQRRAMLKPPVVMKANR